MRNMSIYLVEFYKKLYRLKSKYYNKNMERKFEITGMACASCQQNVQKVVSKIPGVRKVNVNLVSATMTLECDDNVTAQSIINQVKNIGYGAKECSNQSTIPFKSQTQLKKN